MKETILLTSVPTAGEQRQGGESPLWRIRYRLSKQKRGVPHSAWKGRGGERRRELSLPTTNLPQGKQEFRTESILVAKKEVYLKYLDSARGEGIRTQWRRGKEEHSPGGEI